VAALLTAALGCDAGGAASAAVRGSVYYKGAPLAQGTIVFIPDEDRGGSGPLARAAIQADGSYVLQTGGAAGAPAGWHRVTVTAAESGAGGPRSLLPTKYSDPGLSGLSCEVKAGRENRIDFRLE
jgi:hypothetical protein